ncbi:MAG: sigma-70 family RNA polymerase sigma factor [Bacteroidetes bacterium]|nr:sigma-70 family RNA polymerase sigma factor [Bacteroidota bacterium]
MTEADLIFHCKEKNTLAQRILFDRYYQQCFHFAFRYLGNHHDVEDILSLAFTRIFKKIVSFENRGEGSLNKWINTIVINESLRFVEKKRIVFYPDEIEHYMDENLDDYFDSSIDCEKLYAQINELPIAQKLVFNLFVLDEYSHQEIADKLKIPVNTSKSHLHRAKTQLRNKLVKVDDYEKE